MTNEQYEDLVYFLIDEMTLDLSSVINAVTIWGFDQSRLSANFFMLDHTRLEQIRHALFDVANRLWLNFKNLNMFDFNNGPETSFPFVLSGINGTNLMFLKDNVISSNEVNIYGKYY